VGTAGIVSHKCESEVGQNIAKPKTKQERKPPGPTPELLKIEGDWKNAVKKALQKKKPPGGWPKPRKANELRERHYDRSN
jgi:hypothetical protein